nr:spermidine/putrescine ABC transporter permease PotC [Candidatus Pantoea persica]
MRAAIGKAFQLHHRQRFADARGNLRVWGFLHEQAEGDVLERRHMRKEGVALEHGVDVAVFGGVSVTSRSFRTITDGFSGRDSIWINYLNVFLSYVAVETQAKPQARQVPGSEGQWRLARQLQEELTALGFVDVSLSDHCCVMGTLPANVDWPTPVIGFISHMDTSPDFTAKHVSPQIIKNYRGGDIALGTGEEILSPVMFPVLHNLIGHTLITTATAKRCLAPTIRPGSPRS